MSATTAEIDFGRRAEDYAQYRPGFPESFYERLERFVPLQGATALDLGTGPATVALVLAQRGANVVGIDISKRQIEQASAAAMACGLKERTAFRIAPAEHTALPDSWFDLAIAGQSWVWFDRDAALAEVKRVLKPGGTLVIAHYCYLPSRSPVAHETEQLVLRHNPGWTMAGFDGLYPRHVGMVEDGGLDLVEQFCYDHLQPFTHDAWRGRIRTCNGVGSGVMSNEQVAAFDEDLRAMLAERFPQEPLLVWHRVWAVVARTKSA